MSTRKRSIHRLGFVLSICLLAAGLADKASGQSTWQKMKMNIFQQQCQQGYQKACQALAEMKQKLSQQSAPAQAPVQQPAPQPQTAAQPRQPAYRPAAASGPSTGSDSALHFTTKEKILCISSNQ